MPVINGPAADLIKEAIAHGEVIRSWLRPETLRVADRLAKSGFLVRGQINTGSLVSRNVNYRFDLVQVPLKCLPDLLSGGVLKVGTIRNNLVKGDRLVFTGESPWKGGKVQTANEVSAWIEDEKGSIREYSYDQLQTLEIVWVIVNG